MRPGAVVKDCSLRSVAVNEGASFAPLADQVDDEWIAAKAKPMADQRKRMVLLG
jgi:hypothetical protein